MFVPFLSLRECPWKWPDQGAYLTSKALSLSPCKASWALLRQGVVVGILLWSVKQHLSVGDTQRRRRDLFCFGLYGFIERSDEDVIGNRTRAGSDMQQRAPGRDSNLGPLQRGHSLCSTNWVKQLPRMRDFRRHTYSLIVGVVILKATPQMHKQTTHLCTAVKIRKVVFL